MKEAYSAQDMSTPEIMDSGSHDQIEDDFCSSRSVIHQQTSTAPTSNYLLSRNQPDIHVTITSR